MLGLTFSKRNSKVALLLLRLVRESCVFTCGERAFVHSKCMCGQWLFTYMVKITSTDHIPQSPHACRGVDQSAVSLAHLHQPLRVKCTLYCTIFLIGDGKCTILQCTISIGFSIQCYRSMCRKHMQVRVKGGTYGGRVLLSCTADVAKVDLFTTDDNSGVGTTEVAFRAYRFWQLSHYCSQWATVPHLH